MLISSSIKKHWQEEKGKKINASGKVKGAKIGLSINVDFQVTCEGLTQTITNGEFTDGSNGRYMKNFKNNILKRNIP